MLSFRVGQTEIPYTLRRVSTVSERRISVTPGSVEVLVLTTDDDATIADFLARKRQWLFQTVRELEEAVANRPAVPRFMTGSKIPFRGRQTSLTVRRHDGHQVEVIYRNGFVVDLPVWVTINSADTIVAQEIKQWLKQRVRRDVREVAEEYVGRIGRKPRSIRVAEFRTGWGSCGAKGTINIDWRLIFAPKRVLEYVVVHELAHLKHRSHGKKFWDYLEQILPSYFGPKAWLEAHQAALDGGFFHQFSDAATSIK
jgi:predicted metal-dependent hydrolase